MIAFSLGSIHIYRYGIFYFIGFLIGYFFLKYLGNTNFLTHHSQRNTLQKLLKNNTDDILIAIVIGGIIGGRLGHVLIYDLTYFIHNPQDIFAIRKGGMSFIGGMIGGLGGLYILKRIKQLSRKEFFLLLDSIVIVVPIGIMLGRIGNFLNQELYGILVDPNFRHMPGRIVHIFKTLQIFHHYPQAGEGLRINTNFLASFFEGLLGFVILFSLYQKRYKKNKITPGLLVSIFLIRYSLIRFLLEYIRQDSQSEFLGRFSKSQRFFIGFFIFGIILFIISKNYNDQ